MFCNLQGRQSATVFSAARKSSPATTGPDSILFHIPGIATASTRTCCIRIADRSADNLEPAASLAYIPTATRPVPRRRSRRRTATAGESRRRRSSPIPRWPRPPREHRFRVWCVSQSPQPGCNRKASRRIEPWARRRECRARGMRRGRARVGAYIRRRIP